MKTLKQYLASQAEACARRFDALRADCREDEAVFQRIRGNVFDIFRTVADAAEKQPEPMAFFRQRLTDIPAAWETALMQAQRHGDEGKAHIESIKLEAVREIRAFLGKEDAA